MPPTAPCLPLLVPQTPVPHPVATAAPLPTTAANPTANTSNTTTRATASTQTTSSTAGIDYQALNDIQERLREDEQACSQEPVVYSTERPCQPHHPQRRSVLAPRTLSVPLLAPLAPVLPHEPTTTPHASMRTATSPTTCSSSTTQPPAPHHPELRATPRERRRTLPDPSKQPRSRPIRPSSPKFNHKRAVSPLLTSLTADDRSPTPAATVLRRLSLAERLSSPGPPCLTAPAHFDWAKDAATLPTAPTLPRDISGLKTGRPQPFGTLRRRPRRRQTPPNFFPSPRFVFHSALPSHVPSQPFITRCHPSGIGPGKLVIVAPVGVAPAPAAPVLKLDWDQDPRLADLSRAFRALGWAPC